MRRYAQAKEVDEALRGALVLADLKTHENRAPPERLLALPDFAGVARFFSIAAFSFGMQVNLPTRRTLRGKL